MMNIGIQTSKHAYTPEAYAYEDFLKKQGHSIQLEESLNPNNDLNIYFMGYKPFWHRSQGRAINVHEYHSLSTPPYSHFKDIAKRFLNKKPEGHIFLNQLVHQYLGFNCTVPYIYRDMGVDEIMFQTPSSNPKFDIVYCGSIKGRFGLIEILLKLAKKYKIAVIGKVCADIKLLLKHVNIQLFGALDRLEIASIYQEAKYGLNYTPDIYPYNLQTSTKTLEYLASGLIVISNKYYWSETFFRKINYQPVWLQDINDSIINLEDYNQLLKPSVIQEYAWSNVLANSNINNFLKGLVINENLKASNK